ncbi:MAG: hypothetical protein H0W50_07175 [Parachlamydiaceae bacterium]|nr:hypothetical protein [Parachlamydiaceae bacterium]
MINPRNPIFRTSDFIRNKHTYAITKTGKPGETIKIDSEIKIRPKSLSSDTSKKEINFTAHQPLSDKKNITSSFHRTINREQIEERRSVMSAIGEKLPMVQELRTELNKNGSAIVSGSSGSGKSEQISIALGPNHTLFDLRHEFLEDYLNKNQVPKEDRQEVGMQYYSSKMKKQERKFIEENKQPIIEKLLEDKNHTIVLDEIDLAAMPLLSEDELASCLTTLEIAEELKKNGKKVVLILHNSGMQSSEVKESLQNKELLRPNAQVIQTRYLDETTQRIILNSLNLGEYEINRLTQISSGNPATYLGFLKECAKNAIGESGETTESPKFEELIRESYQRTDSNWYWTKQLESKETVQLLTKLASGDISLDDEEVQYNKGYLLTTGMVGEVNGKLIMSQISKDTIIDEQRNEQMMKMFAGKYIEIQNEKDIQTHLSKAPQSIQDAARHALNYSSGCYLTDELGGIPVIIPKTAAALNEFWMYNKKIVSDTLELNNLPMEHSNIDHLTWANSATTPKELVRDAHEVGGYFFDFLNKACSQTDATLHTGESHKFLVKSEKSIQQKANKLATLGANPTKVIQKINDPIRATVICNTMTDLKNTILRFNIAAKQSLIKVVYSNKWDLNYTNGYVGVHANFLISYSTDGIQKKVRGEVQFHLSHITDGSATSPDAIAHILYEEGRLEENPEVTLLRELSMKNIFSSGIKNVTRNRD